MSYATYTVGEMDDGVRRFQYAIVFIARKNGKSLFASGLAIYELIFGEEGGEVYSLATKMDQAKLCWDGAVQMINKSVPDVKTQFKIVTNSISNENNWSFYRPLGRESKSLDGLNPSFCIYDEAAAYSDRNIVDVMTSATGARKNFLHLFITTAQFSRTTVFYENLLYARDVLKGRIDNDRWFAAIYSLDEDDDWSDPNVWEKANPNLGVSIQSEFLENEIEQAKSMQSKRNNVLVKHMNIFTNNEESWLDLAEWDKNKGPIIRSGDLYIGMDLASTRDLTALCFLWDNGDKFSVDYMCFLPRKSMELVPTHVLPKYEKAIFDKMLHLNPGPVTDYQQVLNVIQQHVRDYDVKMVGYDKHNANWLVTQMEDLGIPHIDIGQGMMALTEAVKTTETLVANGNMRHEGNPFIDWQLECCSVYTDKNENVKVTKEETDKSLKIDAIIAMIMAVSMAGTVEETASFNFNFMEL